MAFLVDLVVEDRSQHPGTTMLPACRSRVQHASPLAVIGTTDGRWLVELRQLRYFLVTAEESHIGRAAARLFMAQSSLSQSLQQLEAELGTPLFQRHARGVTPTAAGAALLAPVRTIVDDADALVGLARRANEAPRPPLTLGYVDYARSRVVPALLHHLQEGDAAVTVTLRGGHDSPEVLVDLREGRVDAAVLRSPLSAPWAATVCLVEEAFFAALPRTHRLAAVDVVPLRALADEPFALFPRDLNPGAHDHLMGFFDEAGYRPRVAQPSRRMGESLLFVASGQGVGLFPAAVAHTTNDPDIVFRPLVDPTPRVELVLAWDPQNRHPAIPDLVRAAHAVGPALQRGPGPDQECR